MDFEQFFKSIYYINGYVRIPYLNINLDNTLYIKKNKWDFNKLRSDVLKIYEQNIEKFKNEK